MTKVCIVLQNHPGIVMGGAQYQGHLLAEELARRPGVEVMYLARDIPPGAASRLNLSYAVGSMGTWAGIRRRAALFDLAKLWRVLSEIRPDVIYQQMRQSYTALCAHYSAQARIPFFFQIASDLDLSRRWVTNGFSGNVAFDIGESVAGLWGLRHAGQVIAQTQRQSRVLYERFGRAAYAVVRNFQPLPEHLPGKPAGPVEVFWVANFKEVKRPELFVRLAESFAGREDLRFTMAGRPAVRQAGYGSLMDRIARTPNLEFLGELPIEAVNERMARAAIHVNTSSVEGFPNTFIQAWAQGAAVVTIAVDPDEEGMEKLGIGICAGTFERFRTSVDQLARSPQQRLEMTARAFAFAHANHSLAQGARLADLMLEAADTAARCRMSLSATRTGC